MISLKKYLDADDDTRAGGPDPGELLPAVLKSYGSALQVMGQSAVRACPALGSDLKQNLDNLGSHLARDVLPLQIEQTGEQVEEELRRWGDRTEQYFKARTNDVKELLIVLAGTAESVGARNKQYASQFTQFTSRLQSIADLEDLTQVRDSLVQGATELKTYVQHMEKDGHDSLAQLHAKVSTYETRLKIAEELALRDPLTGLPNRRGLEERIIWRVVHQQTFCIALLDLNHFKQVNDRYGHPAGDSLLKQFSQELRANVRNGDLVGRWSGDEFIVVLDCDLAGAVSQMSRIQQWVFGDYSLQLAAGQTKVAADAAVGVVEWRPGESAKQVVERADAEMYRQKKAREQKEKAR